MRVPMRVLRMAETSPTVLVSTVLTVVLLALLPPVVGLVGFLACVVVLGALALGYLERPTVRVLGRARDPGEGELAVLAPLVARLGGMGIGVGDLYIARTQHSPPPAAVLGRSSFVVSSWRHCCIELSDDRPTGDLPVRHVRPGPKPRSTDEPGWVVVAC